MNVGTVEAVIRLRNEFSAELNRVVSDMSRASREIEKTGRNMVDLGARTTRLVTVPIVAAGAAVSTAAMDFQSSFAGIEKTVEATAEEFAVLSQGMRDLAKEIPVNVNILNRIGESAGQLGIAKENILDFTKTISTLTTTTNLTAEAAASDFARIVNITQLGQDKFSNLASAVVDLGNNFATTEAEIVTYGLYLAGTGTKAGLTAAEILAVGTAASAAGIQAEAGGTAIQKVWLAMMRAVADGGDKLALFGKTSGRTAQEFADLWRSAPAKAFTEFVEGLGNQTQEMSLKTMKSLSLTDARLTRTIMNLSGAGDLLSRAVTTSTEAFAANNAHTIEAEKRYRTMHSQLRLLGAQFRDVGIEIGTSLFPVMRDLIAATLPFAKRLADIAQWFSALPEPVRAAVVVFAGLTAAIGPAVFVAGQLITAWGTLAGFFPAIVSGVTAVVGVLSGPVGLVALGAALVLAWEPARELYMGLVTTAWGTVIRAFESLSTAVREYWGEAKEGRSYTVELAKVISSDLVDALKSAGNRWLRFASQMADTYKSALASADDWLGASRSIAIAGKFWSDAAKDVWSWVTANDGFLDSVSKLSPVHRAIVSQLREWDAQAKRNVLVNQNLTSSTEGFNAAATSTDDVISDAAFAAARLAEERKTLGKTTGELTDEEKKLAEQIAKTTATSQLSVANLTKAVEIAKRGGVGADVLKEMVKVAEQLGVALEHASVSAIAVMNVDKADLEKHLEYITTGRLEEDRKYEAEAKKLRDQYAKATLEDRMKAGKEILENRLKQLKKENDEVEAAAEKSAKAVRDFWDGVADSMGRAVVGSLMSAVIDGENIIKSLSLSILDIWAQTMADMLQQWIANMLKMQAVQATANVSGGGSTPSGTGMLSGYGAASASTMAVIGVFAAAAYAWYNDRQKDYTMMQGTITELSKIFERLSDTLGQYLPAFASGIAVRNDGDRFKIRSGTDAGGAEWKYFDDMADAFSAAVLSSLREMLNEGDAFGPGRLGHLGEEAAKVIGSITDNIIQMGQAGVEWLERGLELAGKLDNLGKSEMQIQLAQLEREYQNNIRLAAEYGLSLSKVGDLYRQQLGQIEQSLRSRIAQYLPGYDPIKDEFDQIRADNNALKEQYAKQREALQAHIAQVLASIERLSNGIGGGAGSPGGAGTVFNQIDEYMRQLMGMAQSGLGLDAGQTVTMISNLMDQLEAMGRAAGGEGGSLRPDQLERLAQQRALLEDLMRQLGLIGQGLSDEEIAEAERAARRRSNQSGRANTRASDQEQLRKTLDDRAFEIATAGLSDLHKQLAQLNRQREQELLLAHGSEELIARLNEQYEILQQQIRSANADQVRRDFREFIDFMQGPLVGLRDNFQTLRDRILEAGFTAEVTESMIDRLTAAYERQAAAIVAEGRESTMSGVQPWLDAAEGVGGQEREWLNIVKQFEDARQALKDLARDAAQAGRSTEWLAGDLQRLDAAQQAAAQQLTLNLIGSLKSLGANIPADKVMQLAQAQWNLAKIQAIAAATALAAAGGFKGLTITLEEVLGWIEGASFEASTYYPQFNDLTTAITDVGSAASDVADDMARARDILLDYYNGMLTGPNSPLTIMQKYQQAQADYAAALAAYNADPSSETAGALTDAADNLLNLAGQAYGTASATYTQMFADVRQDIGDLIGLQNSNILDGTDRFVNAAGQTTASVDRVADIIDIRSGRGNSLLEALVDVNSETRDDIRRLRLDLLNERGSVVNATPSTNPYSDPRNGG